MELRREPTELGMESIMSTTVTQQLEPEVLESAHRSLPPGAGGDCDAGAPCDRGTGGGAGTGHDRPVRGRPLPDYGSARHCQDAAGAHHGANPGPGVQAHPVHAGPDAQRYHRHRYHRRGSGEPAPHLDVRAGARSSATSCWPTKSTARLPRRRAPCSKPCRNAPARCAATTTRCRRRSSCWPPRTPSNWKAPIRCPKRSWTASCSIPCWTT